MERELKEVITLIETSTGKDIKLNHERACRTLLAVSTEKKRLEYVEDVLKSNLIGSEKLPYISEEGEIREETKGIFSQDVRAIRKELPKEVFYNACSIVKSRLAEKDHQLTVEKYTKEEGRGDPFIKIYPATKQTKLDITIKLS